MDKENEVLSMQWDVNEQYKLMNYVLIRAPALKKNLEAVKGKETLNMGEQR